MSEVNVMLVEDSGILVGDIRETLEGEVNIPWVFASGEEAIDRFEDISPDLILMDIKLDGPMDGVETTQKIRETSDVPIVYLTAYSNEQYLDRVRESDALAFLIKPVEKEDLRRILEWVQADRPESKPKLERGTFLP